MYVYEHSECATNILYAYEYMECATNILYVLYYEYIEYNT